MKTGILKFTGVLIGLIFVLSLLPQSAAAPVWSDDFGDGNYNDWTVTEGTWSVDSGILESEDLGLSYGYQRLWHPSSQVEGTWSFDHWSLDTWYAWEANIMFMAIGTHPDYYGYGIRVSGDAVLLLKLNGGSAASSLGLAVFEDLRYAWLYIDITRNSTGGINVYVNATSDIAEPLISFVDTEYSYSERFVIEQLGRGGDGFDNFVVSDTIDITPPAPTTPTENTTTTTETTTDGGTPPPIDTTLLLIGGGVAGVVIIAAVVFMRRL